MRIYQIKHFKNGRAVTEWFCGRDAADWRHRELMRQHKRFIDRSPPTIQDYVEGAIQAVSEVNPLDCGKTRSDIVRFLNRYCRSNGVGDEPSATDTPGRYWWETKPEKESK